ncbi:hypothetical protein LB543_18110 [Mesorhizobium sp. ESP7-2]|uniref:hypothetical protein n=1 Tax=Mesorhizobium sp. ESP7-2 TaxID=2876622 RepID=UPI001CC910A5|nr:hypothetical protein [Mesorhizobium sp. ESP7-2]MBZ9708637.1 hypothetical protein [Mesorhizobium sp. ESP7-2]
MTRRMRATKPIRRGLFFATMVTVALLLARPGYCAPAESSLPDQPINTPPIPIRKPQPVDPAVAATPADASALGDYDVLIADRGNNRLLLVSPQKKILWEYHFADVPPGSGADDAFFADDGNSVITNLEHQQVIRIIDRKTKKVTWEYGGLGRPGSNPGYLDFPDDAYKLPNGDVIVADIRNCRILDISPDKKIVRQAGITGRCWGEAPALDSPNGDKPLPNGHVLVSTIHDHSLIELDQNWKEILHLKLPIRYPSDPQMTRAGNFLVAGYTKPGKIIEISRAGKIVWQYKPKPDEELNRPSLAIELPNGNVLATDDLNQRVVVIDKATNTVLWQYGVTQHQGSNPGYLHIPDGLDIIKTDQDLAKAG